MNTEAASEHALIDRLVATLSETPGGAVSREPQMSDGRADAVLDLDIDGAHVRLVIEVKHSGYPRDVREAVWQLRNYTRHLDAGASQIVPMVAAQSLSPGARQFLRDEHVGYFDAGGSLFLPARGSYVFIDRPAPPTSRLNVDALFSGRRALVLMALWAHRGEWVRVHQMAETAMVSPATASETLSEAERRDWVESRGAGPAKERRLVDARGLLDAWSDHQRRAKPPALRRFFVPASGLDQLIDWAGKAFGPEGLDYMVTAEAAAQIYAPYLSNASQLRCRMEETVRASLAVEQLGGHEVKEGWNLGIMFAKTQGEFAFRKQERGVWLASPLQVYLDLLQGGGRSADVAQHLREERLSA